MGIPVETASRLANSVSANMRRDSSTRLRDLKKFRRDGMEIAITAAKSTMTVINSRRVKPRRRIRSGGAVRLSVILVEPVSDVIIGSCFSIWPGGIEVVRTLVVFSGKDIDVGIAPGIERDSTFFEVGSLP